MCALKLSLSKCCSVLTNFTRDLLPWAPLFCCCCRALVRLQAKQQLRVVEPRRAVRAELQLELTARRQLGRAVLAKLAVFKGAPAEQLVRHRRRWCQTLMRMSTSGALPYAWHARARLCHCRASRRWCRTHVAAHEGHVPAAPCSLTSRASHAVSARCPPSSRDVAGKSGECIGGALLRCWRKHSDAGEIANVHAYAHPICAHAHAVTAPCAAHNARMCLQPGSAQLALGSRRQGSACLPHTL